MKKIKEIKKWEDIKLGDILAYRYSKDYSKIKTCKAIELHEGSVLLEDVDTKAWYICIKGIHNWSLFLPEETEDLPEETEDLPEETEEEKRIQRYTDPKTGEVDWAEVYEDSYMYDM